MIERSWDQIPEFKKGLLRNVLLNPRKDVVKIFQDYFETDQLPAGFLKTKLLKFQNNLLNVPDLDTEEVLTEVVEFVQSTQRPDRDRFSLKPKDVIEDIYLIMGLAKSNVNKINKTQTELSEAVQTDEDWDNPSRIVDFQIVVSRVNPDEVEGDY